MLQAFPHVERFRPSRKASMARKINEEDSGFESLHTLVGMEAYEIEELIPKLSLDQLNDLISASLEGDAAAAKEIISAVADDPDESKDDDKKPVEDEPFNSLLVPKVERAKSKQNAKTLKKSESGKRTDNTATYAVGDEVAVNGHEATIKTPKGPGGTVGVMINGETKMVDKKDVHALEEGVMGMTGMKSLRRIQELAGLPPTAGEDEMGDYGYDQPEPIESPEPEISAPASPLAAGPTDLSGMDNVDLVSPDAGADMGYDEPDYGPSADDVAADYGAAMGDAPMAPAATGFDAPLAAGPTAPLAAPASPLSVGGGTMAGMPGLAGPTMGGDEEAALEQAITDIENMIPNVKISGFKSLVARLEGLLALAKNAGRAALTESEGRRKKPDDFGHSAVTDPDPRDAHEWLGGQDDDLSDLGFGRKSKHVFDEDTDEFDNEDDMRAAHEWLGGDDDDDLSDLGFGRKSKHVFDEGSQDDDLFGDGEDHRDADDWLGGQDDDLGDLGLGRKRKHVFDEDKLGDRDVLKRARDIMARGGAVDDAPADAKPKEELVGRKTLFDYMREAESTETLGANRNDAIKTMQARMGAGTTTQAASATLDNMVRTGTIKMQGSAYTMEPVDDEVFKTNMNASSAPTGQKKPQPGASANPGSVTTNPGANVQGTANPAYQGG
jgi:hypothetical protein